MLHVVVAAAAAEAMVVKLSAERGSAGVVKLYAIAVKSF